jgi:hypothetical protein
LYQLLVHGYLQRTVKHQNPIRLYLKLLAIGVVQGALFRARALEGVAAGRAELRVQRDHGATAVAVAAGRLLASNLLGGLLHAAGGAEGLTWAKLG